MHRKDPEAFALILDEAADHIARQKKHPGQTLPGVWPLDDSLNEPARLIGVIVTLALAEVCERHGCDMQDTLTSYAEVSHAVPLQLKGGPDIMAANHLRDCARRLRGDDVEGLHGSMGKAVGDFHSGSLSSN